MAEAGAPHPTLLDARMVTTMRPIKSRIRRRWARIRRRWREWRWEEPPAFYYGLLSAEDLHRNLIDQAVRFGELAGRQKRRIAQLERRRDFEDAMSDAMWQVIQKVEEDPKLAEQVRDLFPWTELFVPVGEVMEDLEDA